MFKTEINFEGVASKDSGWTVGAGEGGGVGST